MDTLTDKYFIRLPFDNISNCRDLGGYYASRNQSVTSWKKILRSSSLDEASEQELEALANYGIKTIIDLRTADELAKSGRSDKLSGKFNYQTVDLIADNFRASKAAKEEPYVNDDLILYRMYTSILDNKIEIKKVFDIIFDQVEEGGLLFNCSAGKDRTGIIAFLILGLSGASMADIVSNYQVSATNIQKDIEEGHIDFPLNVLASDPEIMEETYAYFLEKYKFFDNYFIQMGYTIEQLDKFIDYITD